MATTTSRREADATSESAPRMVPGDAQTDARPSRWTARAVAVVVHRYVGLALAVFLFMAGVTGSLLAFQHELDATIAPGLHRVSPPSPDATPLDPIALRDTLQARLPAGSTATYVPLDRQPGSSLVISVEGGGDNEYFLNPYTGETLGSRTWGDLGQGAKNLMPFVYRLHYSLALDDVGVFLLGVIALLWTIDCFVGAYVTFPPSRRASSQRTPSRSWLRRWKPSWLLRGGKLFSLVFTWHRASGLWVWGLLLVFAWSSVAFNLQQVYHPVMAAVFGMEGRVRDTIPALESPRTAPRIEWQTAHERGRAVAQQLATEHDFEILAERSLGYEASNGAYQYRVRSTLDVSDRFGSTRIWIDGDSGKLVAFELPTGRSTGNTLTMWLYNLHTASIAVGGWPYRVIVSILGLLVALLSVTGCWVWLKKRRSRLRGHADD